MIRRKLPICTSVLPTIDARTRMDDMGMMISDDAVKVSREELHTYCQLASKDLNFIVLIGRVSSHFQIRY